MTRKSLVTSLSKSRSLWTSALAVMLAACVLPPGAEAQGTTYRVLATNKTSTMQKEMQEAGDAGYRFVAAMGGDTAIGGKEVVVLMERASGDAGHYEYRVQATNRTSTLQRELQELADQGFQAVGMTVGATALGGKELVVITRRKAQ
jgi:hypothetical protein